MSKLKDISWIAADWGTSNLRVWALDQNGNIVKTINYDDEILTMSYKEILVFNEIERYVRKFDNCCRIIIPMVFVVFISIIYSYN